MLVIYYKSFFKCNNWHLKFHSRWIVILVHTAVLTHCQIDENPCSNHEIHILFEHGFELVTYNEHWIVCMKLYGKALQPWQIILPLLCEKVTPVYDILVTLWRSKVWLWSHFLWRNPVSEKGYFNVLEFSVQFWLESGKICKNNNYTCLFHCINTCHVPNVVRPRVQTASLGPSKC